MNFDINTIIGKSISDVLAMGIDFDTSYPTVENGVVTGTADGNYPDEFNSGKWEIINDSYAVATEDEE